MTLLEKGRVSHLGLSISASLSLLSLHVIFTFPILYKVCSECDDIEIYIKNTTKQVLTIIFFIAGMPTMRASARQLKTSRML